EHPFLVCCFWLVEQYAASGRTDDANTLLDTLLACGNDLGLFAEEYEAGAQRMAGNFPQAFSHLGLIRAVDALAGGRGASAGPRAPSDLPPSPCTSPPRRPETLVTLQVTAWSQPGDGVRAEGRTAGESAVAAPRAAPRPPPRRDHASTAPTAA